MRLPAASVDLELVRHIEELAASAWRAEVVEPLDGWRLRWTHGVTRRANSVLANQCGGSCSLSQKLERVEAFYRARGSPARYQLTAASLPPDLDAALEVRGYRVDARTCVQGASVPVVLERAAAGPGFPVRLASRVSKRWAQATFASENPDPKAAAVRRSILGRISAASAYALLEIGGEPAAVGLGVAEGEWMGVFGMFTYPQHRRRGAATAVLHSLAAWGRDQGCSRIYLQVMEENRTARFLYARPGFETLYEYYYRESPSLSVPSPSR